MSAEVWAKVPGTIKAASCATTVMGAKWWADPISCVGNCELWHMGFTTNPIHGVYCATPWGYIKVETEIENKWNHIVMTYNGSILKLYVNGEFRGSKPGSGNLPHPGPKEEFTVFVGHSSPEIWEGGIHKIQDEAILYNRVLDKWEIANHYNMGKPKGYPEASVD